VSKNVYSEGKSLLFTNGINEMSCSGESSTASGLIALHDLNAI